MVLSFLTLIQPKPAPSKTEETLCVGGNAGECAFVMNFLRLKKIKCSGAMSTFIAVYLFDERYTKQQVIKMYKAETGVDLADVNKDGLLQEPRNNLKIDFGQGKLLKDVAKEFSRDSLMSLALKNLRDGTYGSNSKVKSIEYRIHPIILADLKRGELLDGDIQFVHDKYDDGKRWLEAAR